MVRVYKIRKERRIVSKKLLALLLCALLLLSLVGCLEDKAESETKPAATAAVDTSKEDALPAFTLGDFTVTVGEVRSSYNTIVEYMGYYGVAAPSTAEETKQYKDMIIEGLLNAKVLPWKAQQMGIELTEEKKEQVARQVEELIAEYAGDYLDEAKAELGEQANAAELAKKAREILEKEVEEYFNKPFSEWLEEVTTSYSESALTELMQEKFNEGVSVTEEQAKNWFDGELAEQKESFDKDYTAYKAQVEAYRLGESDVPALYTPEGFAQMQVLTFDIDEKDSAAFSANELEMTNLETEYGKLVLRGENEERQAEILARYKELQATNAELLTKNSEKGQKARADALNGMDFTEIYTTYSKEEGAMGYYGYAEDEPKRDGVVTFYIKDKDTEWPEEVWTVAKDMKEGEISELLQAGDSFYLIKRLKDLPAGEAAFDDDVAAYTAAALSTQQAKEWEAVQEDWQNEARNAAVFYEDNYASVGVK